MLLKCGLFLHSTRKDSLILLCVLQRSYLTSIKREIVGVCTAYVEVFTDASCKWRAHVYTNTCRNMTSLLPPINICKCGQEINVILCQKVRR